MKTHQITILSFAIIANLLLAGCAGTRVYDQGKPAVATYGDSQGKWYYKSKTAEFSFDGTLNHSSNTAATYNGISKVTTAIGATGIFLAH